MKRSGVVHLAAALFAALYLLASSPVAAQYTMVSLSDEGGVQVAGRAVSATATITSDISACLEGVGAFAIRGFDGPPNTIQFFKVTQTVSFVLGFSNSLAFPFTDTINILVPLDENGNGESDPFYIKGVGLGQTAVYICNDQQQCAAPFNPATAIVVKVDSVDWEATIDSPLDDNPNTGGGRRIFPEKKFPGDPTPDRERTKVKVKIALSAEHARLVHLKAFDVDDPSTDNTVVDKDGPGGIDNRGTTPSIGSVSGIGTASGMTGPDGTAEFTFQVSKQPGDNFRIAGTCIAADRDGLTVDGVGVKDSSGRPLPTNIAKITPMLTVWRRLHIEVDSMEPVAGNVVEGTVTKARPSERKGRTVVILADAFNDHLRFQPGRITIDGIGSFPVVDTNSSTVTVQGVIAQDPADRHFVLVDDDDFNDNDVNALDGDTEGVIGEDLIEPDRSIVDASDDPGRNVFAPAYVKPTYDLSNPNPKVPFLLNYPGTRRNPVGIAYNGFDNRGTSPDIDFWTAYLLGAYQGTIDEDGDGGDASTVWGYGDTTGASIFLEVGRPWEEQKYADKAAFVNQAATTAHELGHWFNAPDCNKGNPDPEGGLMCWPNFRKKGSFSAKDLNYIRCKGLPATCVGASAAAVGASAAAAEASDIFSIEAYASKKDYVLGNVVRLTIRVTNVSGQTVETPEIPSMQNGLVRLFVADKEAFREYKWPGVRSDGDSAGFQVSPGQVLETEATIMYLDTDYAFAKAGTYRIKAVVVAGEAVLESQPVTIRVNEPMGADLEVWKVLQANPELGYFVQFGAPRTYLRTAESATLVKTLNDLIVAYPDSRQADDILLSLARYRDVLEALNRLEQEQ
ncbi:MAG TPA: hypothetical protein VHC97_00940 [Thermoanaerobaculia bacterium]|jgi:hypothetical protein|nr:hypothetical protein [Thermoanaerobaculia bacterium]